MYSVLASIEISTHIEISEKMQTVYGNAFGADTPFYKAKSNYSLGILSFHASLGFQT